MENSTRDYKENLIKSKPTNIVHIQYNKGYKQCEKKLCENKSHYDIGDVVNHVLGREAKTVQKHFGTGG